MTLPLLAPERPSQEVWGPAAQQAPKKLQRSRCERLRGPRSPRRASRGTHAPRPLAPRPISQGQLCSSNRKCPTALPHLSSQGEGEATAAALNALGFVDAVASEDVDSLLFGARRVFKELELTANNAKKISWQQCARPPAKTHALLEASVLSLKFLGASGLSLESGHIAFTTALTLPAPPVVVGPRTASPPPPSERPSTSTRAALSSSPRSPCSPAATTTRRASSASAARPPACWSGTCSRQQTVARARTRRLSKQSRGGAGRRPAARRGPAPRRAGGATKVSSRRCSPC